MGDSEDLFSATIKDDAINRHDIAPDGYKDITPIAPPKGCAWKGDPIPSSDD